MMSLISSCAQISQASSWHADPVTLSVLSLACEYIHLLILSWAPNLYCNRSSFLVNFELLFVRAGWWRFLHQEISMALV